MLRPLLASCFIAILSIALLGLGGLPRIAAVALQPTQDHISTPFSEGTSSQRHYTSARTTKQHREAVAVEGPIESEGSVTTADEKRSRATQHKESSSTSARAANNNKDSSPKSGKVKASTFKAAAKDINNLNAGAHADGAKARERCEALKNYRPKGISLNASYTFAQYFPAGSNPSLELLAQLYPAGLIDSKQSLATLLGGVGPDVDIKRDVGYGWNSRKFNDRGPLGGLPPFCRFGALIHTSSQTQTLTEIWMPLKHSPDEPLATLNASDYPTNSTPVSLGPKGEYLKAPSFIFDDEDLFTSTDGFTTSDSPNVFGTQSDSSTSYPSSRSSGDGQYLHGKEILGSSTKGWSGRTVFLGNGGQRGFVPFPGMKQLMGRYGFAMVGSNAGHFGSTGATTWINSTESGYTDNTLRDWGHRSTHFSKVLADKVIPHFYGHKGVDKSYVVGCSQGGRNALASAQYYPTDFDGVLAGSPANNNDRLAAGQILQQKQHRKRSVGAGWFNTGILQGAVHETIMSQCDELDGVKDGVLISPEHCKPDFEKDLLCGATSGMFNDDPRQCLTQPQIDVLKELYKDKYLDGKFVYDKWPIGWEFRATGLTGKAAQSSNSLALRVLRYPRLNSISFDVWNDNGRKELNYSVIEASDDQLELYATVRTDLSEAINNGVKIISYHGSADYQVSNYNTRDYYDDVAQTTRNKIKGKLSNSYRHYEIPGMSHCRDGSGSSGWIMGSVTAEDGGNRPYLFDSRHDMILALIAWTERGVIEDFQVGAAYHSRGKIVPSNPGADSDGGDTDDSGDPELPTIYRDYSYGLIATQKHCPYPQKPVYINGKPTTGSKSYASWKCSGKLK